jgi:hypothetical protein
MRLPRSGKASTTKFSLPSWRAAPVRPNREAVSSRRARPRAAGDTVRRVAAGKVQIRVAREEGPHANFSELSEQEILALAI